MLIKEEKKGLRNFENEKTGEKLRHDKGKNWGKGHEAHDHYHHLKPNEKGSFDFVDGDGKIVPQYSDPSHIYSPSNVWWK